MRLENPLSEPLAALLDESAAVLGDVDLADPGGRLAIGVGTMGREQLERYSDYAHLDPMPRAASLFPTGAAINSSALFSAKEQGRMPFVNEFLNPIGVRETLVISLSASKGRSTLVGILKAHHRPPFDGEDAARLERLAPHLARALQIRRMLQHSRERGDLLQSVVDRNRTGMIAVPPQGPAHIVNIAAREIGRAGDGLALDRTARIVTTDHNARRSLARLQDDVLRGGAGGLVRITRPSGERPYIVIVSPLPSLGTLIPEGSAGVFFAIHDPTRAMGKAPRRLGELLDLPNAAASLVWALVEGDDLAGYAERSGLSLNTVRFHLKTAFARTGAHSQSELVRNALRALDDLGPYLPGQSSLLR